MRLTTAESWQGDPASSGADDIGLVQDMITTSTTTTASTRPVSTHRGNMQKYEICCWNGEFWSSDAFLTDGSGHDWPGPAMMQCVLLWISLISERCKGKGG